MKKWLAYTVLAITALSCNVYYVEEFDLGNKEDDESESFGTAQVLSDFNTGRIQYEEDKDYFCFSADAGEKYRIQMDDITGFEPLIELYDPSYSLVIAKGPGVSNAGYDWWGYNQSGEYLVEEKEAIVFTAETSGEYYLCVSDLYNAHSWGGYTLYFDHQVNLPEVQNLQLHVLEELPAIELSWDLLEDISHYYVYRVELNDSGDPVGGYISLGYVGPLNNNTYRDNRIEFNKTYRYFVRALKYGEQGPASDTVQGSVDILMDPVENVTALAMNQVDFEIQISWDPVEGAEGYRIYRSDTEEEGYGEIHNQSADVPCLYSDRDIMANHQYYYRVVAYFNDVVSPDSIPAGALFDWSNFKCNMDIIDASQGLNGRIEIRFEEKYSNPQILRYDVYRSEDEENPVYVGPVGSFSASDSIGTLFSDTEVNTGQYYFYCVKIILNTEEGELSSDYSWFDSGRAE